MSNFLLARGILVHLFRRYVDKAQKEDYYLIISIVGQFVKLEKKKAL